MVKDNEKKQDHENVQAKYIGFYKDGRLMGTAPHMCRGFECQSEGKIDRSDKIEKE